VRILLVPALLLAAAACTAPPPPGGGVPPPPDAAMPPQAGAPTPLLAQPPAPPPPPPRAMAAAPPPPPPVAPPPMAAAPPPPPPPAAAPAATAASFNPFPSLWGPWPGRLNLSNIAYDRAHVQALVTPYPDCAPHDGTPVSDFAMPLNSTRVIDTPPGADVCWRREILAAPRAPSMGRQAPSGWTEWNRVYTSSGRTIDARL
jgi:hypothetical protein